MDPFTIGLLSSLAASVIAGTGVYAFRGEQYRRRVDAAPRNFIQRLDELISRAVKEGPSNARINSRAIVSMRNSFRRHTVALTELLNSDIDILARQVGDEADVIYVGRERVGRNTIVANHKNDEALYETIRVLERTWEAKRDEVELEIRRLLVLLGLDRA